MRNTKTVTQQGSQLLLMALCSTPPTAEGEVFPSSSSKQHPAWPYSLPVSNARFSSVLQATLTLRAETTETTSRKEARSISATSHSLCQWLSVPPFCLLSHEGSPSGDQP